MPFFGFQKKPLFNRGFRREILKVAIFDPPRKPPEIPNFGHFWPFWDPRFWPLFDFDPKNPFLTPFRPPPKPTPPKNPGKWPFWRKPGFSSKIWTAKRGGGGGLPRDPPKRPFLAIFAHFGHFWPFWPFWPFLANFWPLFDPRMWAKVANFGQKRERNPPQNPPGQTDYI